jgi:Na+/proline symporter
LGHRFGNNVRSADFQTRNIPIIVSLMSFSRGVVSGCFIVPYIWGLFSKKITKAGAFAGVLSGLVTVGGATLVISANSGFSAAAAKSPEMGVAAMAISMVVVPLVSAGRSCQGIKVPVLHGNPLFKETLMKESGALHDPPALGFFVYRQQDL